MRITADDPLMSRTDGTPACQARLSLGFADDGGTTRLVERSHYGPLRVQKPLYPEGARVCHAIVLHPPGGVVGGDQLQIDAQVGTGASAFMTTPGAAKWYKANGQVSRQDVQLDVGAQASLEWLPQETIFFDAAQVQLDNAITVGKGGTYIGSEIFCFGRTASGEVFRSGRVDQRTSIRLDGRLVWFEQARLTAGGSNMTSALGMAGKSVCATLIAVGAAVPSALIDTIRAEGARCLNDGDAFGATWFKSAVVVRYLGNSSEMARRLLTHAWQQLRPAISGRDAILPRIWTT